MKFDQIFWKRQLKELQSPLCICGLFKCFLPVNFISFLDEILLSCFAMRIRELFSEGVKLRRKKTFCNTVNVASWNLIYFGIFKRFLLVCYLSSLDEVVLSCFCYESQTIILWKWKIEKKRNLSFSERFKEGSYLFIYLEFSMMVFDFR